MKNLIVYCILLGLISCDTLQQVANTAGVSLSTENTSPALSNQEVISGLKEALTIGAKKGAQQASAVGGFLKNDIIRLPFPPDAKKVRDKAMQWGLDKKVEKFEATLNQAAEEACKTAAPIFVNAITNMSVKDGFAILKGNENAATTYLKDNTSKALYQAFLPEVKKAIEMVKLTAYWEPLAKKYNQSTLLTGNDPINADLNDYVTKRAMEGLFHLVELKEREIRKDPLSRTTDLLKKVFSTIDP
ncbi:MAG: DUF4197 domain-containing protein [Bacteroidota bacterium]|nr:DUF4197 domain-containing protein [Bacteroidota bacterium]